MPNQVVWVDIPIRKLDRAVKFYSAVLGCTVKKDKFNDIEFAILPHMGEDVGGCLVPGHEATITGGGPLIYLNTNGRLDDAVAKVEPNGGKVLEPKHKIGPYGYKAVILDSEGNRVALHST